MKQQWKSNKCNFSQSSTTTLQDATCLDSIQPNFPPGVLQSDPKFSNKYFNMSKGEDFKGGWNEGKSPELCEEWQFFEDPLQHVRETNGLLEETAQGSDRTDKTVQKQNKALSAERKTEVDEATHPVNGVMSWTVYEEEMEAEMNGASKGNGKNKNGKR